MTTVVLGLGSNQGDRMAWLRGAIRDLGASGARVLAVSPIYESDAMLPEGAPDSWRRAFLNLCVLAETSLEPLALLRELKGLERRLGRKARPERWAPREIDIDILAMERLVFDCDALSLPHPGLLERPFALAPLADLVPEWRYPGEGSSRGRTARELADRWPVGWASEQVPFRTRRCAEFLSEVVGILNLTPDSFSDGGLHLGTGAAVARAEELIQAGVTVLDLGAESTRPGAPAVGPEEEWRRLGPVLAQVREHAREWEIPLSVDTRSAEVALRALRAGADWINDVSGGASPALVRAVAGSGARYVFMHSVSVPPRRDEVLPLGQDPVDQLLRWGEAKISELERAGLGRDRLILDPGIGFAKTAEQSLRILREARRLHGLGVPILIGHSRKSFMSRWTQAPAQERDLETHSVSLALAGQGVQYLRVHDGPGLARVLRGSALVEGATWLRR